MNIAPQLLLSLFAQCSPDVAPETLSTLIDIESSRNPYAIAVVYDKQVNNSDKYQFKQPASEAEALTVIENLEKTKKHKSYSVGIMQINSANFTKYGIDKSNMFNACKNIEAGAAIFSDCYTKAKNNNPHADEQVLLRNAASCYYSGNEIRGYQPDQNGTSYIDRINSLVAKTYKVPAFKPLDAANEDSQQSQAQPKINSSWDIFGDFKK